MLEKQYIVYSSRLTYLVYSIIFPRCTTLCDKVCQWHVTGRWFSPGPISFSSKTPRYSWNIAESGVKRHQTNKQTKIIFHCQGMNASLKPLPFTKDRSSLYYINVRETEEARTDNPETLATLGTQDTGPWPTNKDTIQTTKKVSNTHPIKNRGCTQVLAKVKQFLHLIRHPPLYLYTHAWQYKWPQQYN